MDASAPAASRKRLAPCLAYLQGDLTSAERLHTWPGALDDCNRKFRQAIASPHRSDPEDTGRYLQHRLPEPWHDGRCKHTEGYTAACAFSAKAWGVGRAVRGGWRADLEPSSILSSPDAVRTAQVILDARELRFVMHDATGLARGVATPSSVPGEETLPWHEFTAQQGLAQQIDYWGLPVMKSAWDLQLLSMAIAELGPESIIELGTGSGASAMWLADEAKKQGFSSRVHSFDVKSADAIAKAHGLTVQAWTQLLRQRGVAFHEGTNLSSASVSLPRSLLRELPHPWLVIEDAHVNTQHVAMHLFKHMEPGDYLVCEDIRFAGEKRSAWFAFLEWCGERCSLDLKYCDFFGVNRCCAPDGWMKKIA